MMHPHADRVILVGVFTYVAGSCVIGIASCGVSMSCGRYTPPILLLLMNTHLLRVSVEGLYRILWKGEVP